MEMAVRISSAASSYSTRPDILITRVASLPHEAEQIPCGIPSLATTARFANPNGERASLYTRSKRSRRRVAVSCSERCRDSTSARLVDTNALVHIRAQAATDIPYSTYQKSSHCRCSLHGRPTTLWCKRARILFQHNLRRCKCSSFMR